MFRRTNKLPQRKPFEFTPQQIMDDIMQIRDDEEQRNKLYHCIDEKPPQDYKFNKVEDFLKGSNDLESILEKLQDVSDELNVLEKQLKSGSSQIRSAILEKAKV